MDNLSSIDTKRVNINGMILHLSKCGKNVCGSIVSVGVVSTNDNVIDVENVIPIGWEPITQVNGYGSSSASSMVGCIEYSIGANSRTLSYKFRGGVFAFSNFAYHTNG